MPQLVGAHDGVDGPVTNLEYEDEPSTVFLDSPDGGTVVDDPFKVSRSWSTWERLVANALSPNMSREMINAVIFELPEDA